MLPARDDKFLLIALGAAAMAVVFAWQIGYITGAHSISTTPSPLSALTERKAVTGEITEIKDKTIILKSHLSDSTQLDYAIMTNFATVFRQMVEKDKDAFEKEIQAFNESIESARANNALPSINQGEIPLPFTMKELSLADLRPGDIVQATAGTDISNESKFTATSITRVFSRPAAPFSQ